MSSFTDVAPWDAPKKQKKTEEPSPVCGFAGRFAVSFLFLVVFVFSPDSLVLTFGVSGFLVPRARWGVSCLGFRIVLLGQLIGFHRFWWRVGFSPPVFTGVLKHPDLPIDPLRTERHSQGFTIFGIFS